MCDLLSQDTGYSISYIITVKITYIEQVNYCSNNILKKMKNLKGPRCCGSSSLDRLSGFLVPLPPMRKNDTLEALLFNELDVCHIHAWSPNWVKMLIWLFKVHF